MRNIDLKCPTCGHIVIDHFQRSSSELLPYCRERTADPQVLCGTLYERVFLPTKRNTVISDECDVWVQHGICNEDGTPRHYRFKSEMRAEAARRGLENHVVHKPESKGGDSSRHTSRWV
jgi:hypothetical protein